MRRDTLLIVLTFTGTALCWWPAIIEPSLDLPPWLLLVPIALCPGLSTILSGWRGLRFVVASTVGSLVGLCGGFAIWPPSDPIAGSYTPLVVAFAIGVVLVVSLIACLVASRISVSNRNSKRVLWLALICAVASGPVAFALTQPLVAFRVARNDRVAAERFASLKNAVEQTMAEADGPMRICDGEALKKHYSGPPFSLKDWQFIAGNYVKQDGYVFGIYCQEQGGSYAIDAHPARQKGDGTRQFCTDESRKISCGIEWNRARYACLPCPK